MVKFKPVIKWSGSKRSQCDGILAYFPENMETYYEPFCGGCSMLMGLMNSGIHTERYVCSDINGDLISLWGKIMDCPDDIMKSYTRLWSGLNCDKDTNRKKIFFDEQKKIYNDTHDPFVFFFLMRTCTNGMPRYNGKGEFNSSFHFTRDGIKPELLEPVLYEWSEKLNKHNVEFVHRSYEEILDVVTENDFVYLDPPYFNTKGMYFGGIDFGSFFGFLETLSERNIKFALSFDGKSGDVDNTCSLPESCYKRHLYIKSGKSSFKRITGNDGNAMVYESLYLNYDDLKTRLF